MPHWLYVFLISMVPIIELRGAIPVGAGLGLAPWLNYLVSVVGNMIPVPFILLLIVWFLGVMKKAPWEWVRKTALWVEAKAEKGRAKMKQGAFWGLFLFVAIPLPGTGAWTGALIASLFGFSRKWSLLAIFLGVLLAGLIMTLGSYGVVSIFEIFSK